MIITRRSLLASLGLALPVVVAASGASAAMKTSHAHHAAKHTHLAHAQHGGKPHHTASAHPRTHTKHA